MRLSHLTFSAGIVGLVGLLSPTTALAQVTEGVTAPPTSEADSPSEALPIQVEEEEFEPSADNTQTLNCPPGQFPSAFSDVLPFHWAYEAVNNLASVPMQCFDLPDNYR
ncbi:hypothetical protein PN498_19540 [Oscillatoria sp. CS-180]|uniref:hypothetical protein n=1 Tax=Oscillatoria sp. CS-180 TaxID=3021720 RepID=UPI00232B854E|nr:hypothetical protein [Oscillatoria sp. CS-180]MDB9528195.1 hypothetical protein [Oscillatoria sp. CS-180]